MEMFFKDKELRSLMDGIGLVVWVRRYFGGGLRDVIDVGVNFLRDF